MLPFNYGLNDTELSDSVSAGNTLYNASHKAFLGSPGFYSPGQLLFFPLSVGALHLLRAVISHKPTKGWELWLLTPSFCRSKSVPLWNWEGSGSEGTELIGKLTPSPMPRTLVFGH